MTKGRGFDEALAMSAALERRDAAELTGLVAQCRHLSEVDFLYNPDFDKGTFVTPDDFAQLLLSRAETRGALVALRELEAAVFRRRVPSFHVIAVVGLRATQFCKLGDCLVYPADAFDPRWQPPQPLSGPLGAQPQTLLVRPTHSPLWIDPTGAEEKDLRTQHIASLMDATDDVLNRLSVAARGPGTWVAMWHVRDAADPWSHLSGSLLRACGITGVNVSQELAPDQVRRAEEFRDDEVRATRFAANRYRRAAGTSVFHDAAIDVAVAFESLLLRKEEGELSLRLSLRAAHLIGQQDFEERRRVFEIVRRMYRTRSTLVHRGGISLTEVEIRDQMYDALHLFPSAAERILVRGFPTDDEWVEMLLGRHDTNLTPANSRPEADREGSGEF